jgi:hypothetical protein
MLNIPIDDKYQITSDGRNLILNVRRIIKNGATAGAERLYPLSYHGDFKSLLEKYLTVSLLESDCKIFREVVARVAEVKKIIANIQKQMF